MVDFAVILVPDTELPGDEFFESLFHSAFCEVEPAQDRVVLDGLVQFAETHWVVFGCVGVFQHFHQNRLNQFLPVLHYLPLLYWRLLQVLWYLLRWADNYYLLPFPHVLTHTVVPVDLQLLALTKCRISVLNTPPHNQSVLDQHINQRRQRVVFTHALFTNFLRPGQLLQVPIYHSVLTLLRYQQQHHQVRVLTLKSHLFTPESTLKQWRALLQLPL